MIYKSEIRCKDRGDNWRFKNCLLCEHFSGQKDEKGWTCSCNLNTAPKDRYHYAAIWQTELCILAGTMTPGSRMDVRIIKTSVEAGNAT